MKRTIAVLTIATMTTALGGLPAFAAGTDHNGGMMGTTNGTSTDNTGTMSPGAAMDNDVQSGSMSSGDAMSGGNMMTADQMVSSIQGLKDVTNVKVISLADMANTDTKVQESGATPNTTPEEQQQIQAAIAANPALSSKLQAKSIDVSQIVAANVDANNSVTVYVE